MTDLTDKWKKGEFIICNAGKCQYYYVRNEEQQEVIKTEYCLFDDNTPNWQILAPVPSYEEMQSMNEAVNQAMAANIKLVEENAQLKELLKECKLAIFDYPPYDLASDKIRLTQKIDEALR